jgi:ubiquinone/menaquinone biosynthesis C-methylase UbiE
MELDFGTGFRDVDSTGDAAPFVAYLDGVASFAQVHDAKRERDQRLASAGAHVLDVGCGTGEDARAMGALVGPTGRVVGLDSSGRLLAVASERTGVRHGPVEWVHGDAQRPPFADDEFDAARVERVLMHVADPARVVAEMARVVRPGGRVMAVEPDWATLLIDIEPEASRTVIDAATAQLRHPWIGRGLYRLLTSAGLEDVKVSAETMALVEPRQIPGFERTMRALERQARGTGPVAERAALAEGALRAVATGRCFAALTLFVAEGLASGRDGGWTAGARARA